MTNLSRCSDIQIHIVGLGVSEKAELTEEARSALASADVIMGAQRQLDVISDFLQGSLQGLVKDQKTCLLPALSALPNMIETLQKEQVRSLVVLASGDPLYYGIGRWFGQRFSSSQLRFYPGISSIQAACHQLGLSLQDVQVLSLHGRPMQTIRRQLKQQQTLVILTDKYSTPQVLAQECIAAGFTESRLWICENLGYEDQRVQEYSACELVDNAMVFDPLHVTVISVRRAGGVFPAFPGIPDEDFITSAINGKGMLTKREVRLAILSLIQPGAGDVIWDVGAGCGGVAVELAYWNDRAEVYAVEHNADRLTCLQANVNRFGVVNNLKVVSGRAPECLTELPKPNKVFIGGSDGELEQLLMQQWQQLPERGVLVASAVMETTRQQLLHFYQARQDAGDADLETLQLAVSKGAELAGQLVYRPNLPVTLFSFKKTVSSQYANGENS